jgi:dolichyl-diphosphooligosaccharide--protein glycosyltransferase
MGLIIKIDRTTILALVLILACSILGFYLRSLPSQVLVHEGIVRLFENDPWYSMRQIEVMVTHFPTYNWFEPFTRFPAGKVIDWGPLFPFLATVGCLLVGALTRPEMMVVASWIPPVLALAVIPVVYFTGRTVAGHTAGVVAAIMVALVSGEYFSRSLFGYPDHHIAEALFSTLFCLTYLFALGKIRPLPSSVKDSSSLIAPIAFGALAGACYLLGILAAPTILLFALITSLFSAAVVVRGMARGTDTSGILVINASCFGVAAIGIFLLGVHSGGYSLSQYSISQVLACLLIIGATLLLVAIAWLWKARRNVAIAVVVLVLIGGMLAVLSPGPFNDMVVGSGASFFGKPVEEVPIKEMQPWDLSRAWTSFNVGLVLMAAGLVILMHAVIRRDRPIDLFIFIWALVVLIATILHVRYEYYLAIVVVITGAIAASSLLGSSASYPLPTRVKKTERRDLKHPKEKVKREQVKPRMTSRDMCRYAAVFLVMVFCAASASADYVLATDVQEDIIPISWLESLQWLAENSPDPGIPYLAEYTNANLSRYPGAYGVLSWWDYGHWITFVAKRPAVTNPFQDNVEGRLGAAAFFLTPSETEAERIAGYKDVRYIITDGKMVNTKFRGLVSWGNRSREDGYYTMALTHPAGDGKSPLLLIKQPYYETMVSRLHNLDGTMGLPLSALYVEYSSNDAKLGAPRIQTLQYLPADEAIALAKNGRGSSGIEKIVVNNATRTPILPVPALQHYRLIFDSELGTEEDAIQKLNIVKIFERVKGARIKGEGMITLSIISNTGRNITYRQMSEKGEFVVPYSTEQSIYPVHATGPYRIKGSGKEFRVTEDDVREGRTIG